ncbi:Deoxyribodipyrimidine photo-lyase-related protein [Anaerohalosphaera lusitana]|uniref:Deoxyribodipyrimidine photo-lyase-related protein n=1 Tax=Anaerohalosphaera lusitana TaxID=1936003 RepID=A0A1U9NQY1_9BACT|nr:cryptochrome/photolyase family protein [Anaerohalosphaera lusitana]AQT70197.1 Deoxyribodipyrimidine photo-lyase-related protein [Anaerohalosphaera lusitana]
MAAAIVLPNQLFEDTEAIEKAEKVYLLEEERYFRDFAFHKKKLLLHRASMKAYEAFLRGKGFAVEYRDIGKGANVEDVLRSAGEDEFFTYDPVDQQLRGSMEKTAGKAGVKLHFARSLLFINGTDELRDFFGDSRDHYSMAGFYSHQRKKMGVLVKDGKPVGGKWSFDPENREKLPANIELPNVRKAKANDYVKEAADYVNKRFGGNPGETDGFVFPVTHRAAGTWLKHFLEDRLADFGRYEDSIARDEVFIFHSALSPMINAGLITPGEVVGATLNHADDHKIPLNSLEGFIRQIIGWREFMRAVYELEPERERDNFFDFSNALPDKLYNGRTGVDPVDTVIARVFENAYCHHIERLMVIDNFMLLCEIRPDEVYRWFMEMFIDAYDWVMVPNVFGMSQYADGGLITTKPYISSSNYIRKMSDFDKGSWCDIWDGLYWRFINRHRKVFANNPRMKVMTKQLDRMGKDKLKKRIEPAEEFLKELFA